jgi:hypothetical protein
MTPKLHPDAARNFDEKAEGLLEELAVAPREQVSAPPPQVFGPAHIPRRAIPKATIFSSTSQASATCSATR